MRVFKPTYIVDGKRRTSPRWHVAFRDHRDTRRRVTAFTDKAQSEELGRKIVKLVATVGVGERPDVQLVKWIEALPPSIRDRLASFGLLNERLASASRPLTEHLDDFKAALLAKGGTDRHAVLVTARARKVVDGCKFKYWADVSPSRVETYLKRLRDGSEDKPGVSRQTSNFYLQAIKQFCKWAVQDGRLSESPIAHLSALNVRTDRRHDRRALSVDELQWLLTVTYGGEDRRGRAMQRTGGKPTWGMTGPERTVLYLLAADTGLRSSELRSLTRLSFVLDGDEPSVTVEAAYSKRKRRDSLPPTPKHS